MTFLFVLINCGLLFSYCTAFESDRKDTGVNTADNMETENSKLIDFIISIKKNTELAGNQQVSDINSDERLNTLELKSPFKDRPFFAGQTVGNFRPQLIAPGTPWPSSISNTTGPPVPNRNKENSTTMFIPLSDQLTVKPEIVSKKPVTSPGFIWHTTRVTFPTVSPPKKRINVTSSVNRPDKPQPHKDDVSLVQHQVVDKFEAPTSTGSFEAVNNILFANSSRPFFAGQTGGNFHPQLVPSGTPWPAQSAPTSVLNNSSKPVQSGTDLVNRNEDNAVENSKNNSTSKPQTGSDSTTPVMIEVITIPTRPPPNRPFYAGQTGGHYYPQLIPPGTPWPARPEDYTTSETTQKSTTVAPTQASSVLTHKDPEAVHPPKPDVIDRIENVTVQNFDEGTTPVSNENLKRPIPNRPFFAGSTGGNFRPQLIPPGKPLPSKSTETNNTVSTTNFTVEAVNISQNNVANVLVRNVSKDNNTNKVNSVILKPMVSSSSESESNKVEPQKVPLFVPFPQDIEQKNEESSENLKGDRGTTTGAPFTNKPRTTTNG